MTPDELEAIGKRLKAPHPDGLSLTTWGEQLRCDALALYGELQRRIAAEEDKVFAVQESVNSP